MAKDEEDREPLQVVRELIKLTVKASWQKIRLKIKKAKKTALSFFLKVYSLFFPSDSSGSGNRKKLKSNTSSKTINNALPLESTISLNTQQ